jgi:hypothetical protein
MPAIVHYKNGRNPARTFEQISANFSVELDGYISLSLRFAATFSGLNSNAVLSLFPSPEKPLPDNFFNIRGLPLNRGVFAERVSVSYENGIQYVDIIASSCTRDSQLVVNSTNNSLAYNGVFTILSNPPEDVAYSFTAKIPTVRVSTCYLASEGFPQAVSAKTEGDNINRNNGPRLVLLSPVFFNGQLITGARYFSTTITNAKPAGIVNLANKSMNVVETLSESGDSVVRGTKTYTLEVV